MYDYSGIVYRIWGVGGVLAATGAILVVLSFIVKVYEMQKRFFIGGLVFLLLGSGLALKYHSILKNPEIEVFEGYFNEEYRNSQVAPPLPFTREYTFTDKDWTRKIFYLDTFSRKNMFDGDFVENAQYRIYYEAEHKIIVKIESLNN